MSAVSSESPLAAADLSAPSAHSSSQTHHPESAEPGAAPGAADFGANEWLVDELYERYLNDPGSVDKAWWSFFADYRPVRSVNGTGPQPVLAEARAAEARAAEARAAEAQAPATPAAKAPAAEPAPAAKAASKAAPAPKAPVSKQAAAPKRVSGEKRPPAELAKLTEKLGEYIKAHPGLRIEPIGKALSTPTKELNLPIKKLLAAKTIRSVGQKRATEYFSA